MFSIPVAEIRSNVKALYEQYAESASSMTTCQMISFLKRKYLENHGPLFLGNKLDSTIIEFVRSITDTSSRYIYHAPMASFEDINRNLKSLYNVLLEQNANVRDPIILRVTLKLRYMAESKIHPKTCPKISTERLDRVLDIFIQDLAYRPAYDKAPSTESKALLLKHTA